MFGAPCMFFFFFLLNRLKHKICTQCAMRNGQWPTGLNMHVGLWDILIHRCVLLLSDSILVDSTGLCGFFMKVT